MKGLLFVGAMLALTACSTVAPVVQPENLPKSLLVLPAANQSPEINAPAIFISSLSKPLAERGYYVFPVAVVERMMRENGLHTADEMHAIPLAKLNEHIAPDAVLYITILNWGQQYQVLRSQAVVRAQLKLVDARTGTVLWQEHAQAVQQNNNSQNGLAGLLVGALVDQVVGSFIDATPKLAKQANEQAVQSLFPGPRLIEKQQRSAQP
jgi:hypothetical protein